MQKNTLFRPLYKLLCFFSVFSFLIILDQFLKYKIRLNGGFYLCNHGLSFGISVSNSIFWLILAIFISFFIFFIYKKDKFSCLFIIGMALFLGGAFSNIIDRVFIGCVLDYIPIFKEIFPVFNIADIGISLGAFFIFSEIITKNHLEK